MLDNLYKRLNSDGILLVREDWAGNEEFFDMFEIRYLRTVGAISNVL